MKQVAILVTGQARTIVSTAKIILRNIIQPNEAHVFVYAESEDFNVFALLADQWYPHVKKITILPSTRTEEFLNLSEFLVRTKPALQDDIFTRRRVPKSYLLTSGTLLEYFQFLKAYDLMLEYERESGLHYDILVRTRLDVILTVPLHIRDFYTGINADIYEQCMGPMEYIRSLGNQFMLNHLHQQTYKGYPDLNDVPTDNPQALLNYINSKQILFTIRKNVLWIALRPTMNIIRSLIYEFGSWVIPEQSSFDSESVLANYCFFNNITKIDYFSESEEKAFTHRSVNLSVLNPDGELNPARDPDLLMCIIRFPGWHFDKN